MKYILSGAAAIALVAGGAYAQPGKGHSNGNGQAHASGGEHGNAGKKAGPMQARQADNGHNAQMRPQDKAHAEARPQARRVETRQNVKVRENARVQVRNDKLRDPVRMDTRRIGDNRTANGNGDTRYSNTRDHSRVIDRVVYRDDRTMLMRDRSRSIVDGCPPGLAKKGNGCMPPGQAKKYYDRAVFGYDYRPRLFGLTSYPTGRYYYNDGYLLRYGNGGGISGYIPLLGGALSIGNPWPASYAYNPVPNYYVDYYNLGAPDRYRYADNVIYRVDPTDAAIMGVAALLTGDNFQIGQPMPAGYDVYNVPYAYRNQYVDGPDAMYRYSDGYVYRVDPTTQLVAAAINLLV